MQCVTESFHKNTTNFKRIYIEIADIQDTDTQTNKHNSIFRLQECSTSIKAFLRFRFNGKFVSWNGVSHDSVLLYLRY